MKQFSPTVVLTALMLSFAVFSGLLYSGGVYPGEANNHLSSAGLYQLKFESELDPIEINRIHNWVLYVQAVGQEPLVNAQITIMGGMPEHDHGLATRPVVVPGGDAGEYTVQGLRFHMGGYWELEFTIKAEAGTDKVVVPLEL